MGVPRKPGEIQIVSSKQRKAERGRLHHNVECRPLDESEILAEKGFGRSRAMPYGKRTKWDLARD
jgi:hypothetical protein